MDARDAMIRTAAGLLLLLTLALAAPRVEAATLKVASQNTLHLSDSAKGANKRATIKAQNAKYDVNLLQEVMKSADLKDVRPGSYVFQDTDLKGLSSYKERYAIIYKSALTAKNPGSKMVNLGNPAAKKFSRPPSGTLIQDGSGNLLWFMDFHAIFGKTVTLRRDEAKAMATAYSDFLGTTKWGTATGVVIGGDWNLAADDTGFTALKNINKNKMSIVPNIKTSLTRAGAPSEKYDHFVMDSTKVAASGCVLTPLPTGKSDSWYRNNVSDHRGITCTLTY